MHIECLNVGAAVEQLKKGACVAYPTEGVYGLGCDPHNLDAVKALLAHKQRTWEKGLILIASDFSQLTPFLKPLSEALQANIFPTWPGPHTWLLPAKDTTDPLLTGMSDKLAVRVSAHPVIRELCSAFGGALVSTSANISGHPAALTAQQVRDIFPTLAIVKGALGGETKPTPISDAQTGRTIRG